MTTGYAREGAGWELGLYIKGRELEGEGKALLLMSEAYPALNIPTSGEGS